METAPVVSRAGRDRLSNLPDCLLHGVLSSLRSRQAVQTCLLSRRWRHLWRSVPCLDVDQRDFLSAADPEPLAPGRGAPDADWRLYNRALKERRRGFEDFADAALPLNGAWPLDAYRLHVADRGLRDASYRWIRRGLERRPEELAVAYGYGYTSHYDDPIGFAYGYGYGYPNPHDDHPPFSFDLVSGGAPPLTGRLRRLHLSGVTLAEKFAEELASECPVLEELKLVKCECRRRYDFGGRRIASRSLKRLHVEGHRDGDRSFMWLDPLAVPALVSLHLDMVFLPDCEDELQSLAAASITYPDYYAVGEHGFLKSLRNATALELRSFTTTGLLEDEPEEFRNFHNLRTLILIECDIGDECQVLRYVLENIPNLERLVLKDCKLSGRYRGESASTCSSDTTLFGGCKNLRYIQVQYKNHVVPPDLVVALTQIAKDVVGFRSKRNSAVWLEWMSRVVSCSHTHIVSLGEGYDAASVIVESDDSQSDEEHESRVWKHRARKKHERDGAMKAGRRAAHLARR